MHGSFPIKLNQTGWDGRERRQGEAFQREKRKKKGKKHTANYLETEERE